MSELIETKTSGDAIPDGLWLLTNATADHVLKLLPQMGRVMVIAAANGVTHERIGIVENVVNADKRIQLEGETQDSVIDLSRIEKVTLDLTSVMKDKSYPRLNILAPDDEVLFAIVGFDGKEPFILPLTSLAREALSVEKIEKEEKVELDENDPAHLPFNQALETQTPITIEMNANNITQRWHGVVEKIIPAMGFLNIMNSGFHLHLKGGVVSSWKQEGAVYRALNENAEAIGLVVEFAET